MPYILDADSGETPQTLALKRQLACTGSWGRPLLQAVSSIGEGIWRRVAQSP